MYSPVSTKWKGDERCVLNNQSDFIISTSPLCLASVEINRAERIGEFCAMSEQAAQQTGLLCTV